MDLNELKAKDIMVTEPLAVHPSEQIAAVDLLMSRNSLSGIPVIDGKLIGIITMRDIMLSRFSICVNGLKVEDLMRKDPVCVSPESPLKEVLNIILDQKLEQVPVVEDEQVIGIINNDKILRKIFEAL